MPRMNIGHLYRHKLHQDRRSNFCSSCAAYTADFLCIHRLMPGLHIGCFHPHKLDSHSNFWRNCSAYTVDFCCIHPLMPSMYIDGFYLHNLYRHCNFCGTCAAYIVGFLCIDRVIPEFYICRFYLYKQPLPQTMHSSPKSTKWWSFSCLATIVNLLDVSTIPFQRFHESEITRFERCG